MNLETPTQENIAFLLQAIQQKLTMVNAAIVNPASFTLDVYEELLDLYYIITKKERISIREMEAIVTEIGHLRNR